VAADSVAFSVDGLKAAWRLITEAVRKESPFLGTALSHVAPVEVAPPRLVVALGEPNPLFSDRLEQQADLVERVIGGLVGERVELRVTTVGASVGGPADAPAPRPKRLTQETMKADRLKGIRAKDPSLDAAADELDLEIVD
jgi:hypothetical protein